MQVSASDFAFKFTYLIFGKKYLAFSKNSQGTSQFLCHENIISLPATFCLTHYTASTTERNAMKKPHILLYSKNVG